MNTTVSAVYEHGALRLLNPVQLPESSRVQVQILAQNENSSPDAFARQWGDVQHLLNTLEDEWQDDLIREVTLQLLHSDLRSLWHLAQPSAKMLCAMLQLSARHLQSETFSHEQVEAIRFVLNRLTYPLVSESDIDTCHERLTAAGIPPSFTFSSEMVQSYVDEL